MLSPTIALPGYDSLVVLAAVSAWNVLAAVAALVAAFAIGLASGQVLLIQRQRLKLEREELDLRQHHFETERVWVELLSRHLESEAVLALRPPASRSFGSEGRAVTAGLHARQLEFLARKRIKSVGVADSEVQSSSDDLSFAAGATALMGRSIAAREKRA